MGDSIQSSLYIWSRLTSSQICMHPVRERRSRMWDSGEQLRLVRVRASRLNRHYSAHRDIGAIRLVPRYHLEIRYHNKIESSTPHAPCARPVFMGGTVGGCE